MTQKLEIVEFAVHHSLANTVSWLEVETEKAR